MAPKKKARKRGQAPSQAERLGRIVQCLFSQPEIRVSEIARELGVSEVAIRKDIEQLDSLRLDRFYGGVRLAQQPEVGSFYAVKQRRHREEKDLIAAYAVEHEVDDGDNLLLDSGTQMEAFVRALKKQRRSGIRVFSQAANFADVFFSYQEADYIQLGGVLNPRAVVFLDSKERFSTESFFEDTTRKFFDTLCYGRGRYTAVITGTGFSPDRGIAVNTADIIKYKQDIITLANKVLVLLDHSKFSAIARDTVTYCGLKPDLWLEGAVEKEVVIVVDTNWSDDSGIENFAKFSEHPNIKAQSLPDEPKYDKLRVFKTTLVGGGDD